MEEDRDRIISKLLDVFGKASASIDSGSKGSSAAGDVAEITNRVREMISDAVAPEVTEKYEIIYYGANYVHPGFLAFWICVQSDRERDRLRSNRGLMNRLRQTFVDADYPEDGRDDVDIGFESQETVNRESGGDWYKHFK